MGRLENSRCSTPLVTVVSPGLPLVQENAARTGSSSSVGTCLPLFVTTRDPRCPHSKKLAESYPPPLTISRPTMATDEIKKLRQMVMKRSAWEPRCDGHSVTDVMLPRKSNHRDFPVNLVKNRKYFLIIAR